MKGWQLVFWIVGIADIIATVLYAFLAEGSVQPWDPNFNKKKKVEA